MSLFAASWFMSRSSAGAHVCVCISVCARICVCWCKSVSLQFENVIGGKDVGTAGFFSGARLIFEMELDWTLL